MATKGVWQLKQVTIRYCQHGGSSRYVRQLLGDHRFLKFVEENPQVQFETELKGARHPILIGDYGTYRHSHSIWNTYRLNEDLCGLIL